MSWDRGYSEQGEHYSALIVKEMDADIWGDTKRGLGKNKNVSFQNEISIYFTQKIKTY